MNKSSKRVFEMNFLDTKGKEHRVTITDPAENIAAETAKNAMEVIIKSDIFKTKEGHDSYDRAVSARYVVRSVEDIYDASELPA